ncbi:hypothetical protein [Micromonospora sp. Llam0]|uniref:hypothetical protein n=1 Tax=Micromonospora sp. Llam0 TaxID=2485143 RepID=UPI000F47B84A|nr:hypothetical protein [Micromonospora sp. Llam0]
MRGARTRPFRVFRYVSRCQPAGPQSFHATGDGRSRAALARNALIYLHQAHESAWRRRRYH